MKIQCEISESLIETILRGIMENFPEASGVLTCIRWKYDEWQFKFVDEDEKTYDLDKQKLRDAFPLMFTDKWPKGCTKPPFSNDPEVWNQWLCQADATDFDAFVQLACLGEVIYG